MGRTLFFLLKSNITLFFELLPGYKPKLTQCSIIKSIFFNDVSANNLIDSFTFVECKKLEI